MTIEGSNQIEAIVRKNEPNQMQLNNRRKSWVWVRNNEKADYMICFSLKQTYTKSLWQEGMKKYHLQEGWKYGENLF